MLESDDSVTETSQLVDNYNAGNWFSSFTVENVHESNARSITYRILNVALDRRPDPRFRELCITISRTVAGPLQDTEQPSLYGSR